MAWVVVVPSGWILEVLQGETHRGFPRGFSGRVTGRRWRHLPSPGSGRAAGAAGVGVQWPGCCRVGGELTCGCQGECWLRGGDLKKVARTRDLLASRERLSDYEALHALRHPEREGRGLRNRP